jgi:CelD/BcsL family acetyltransferase involved in cellulose biosynthesis
MADLKTFLADSALIEAWDSLAERYHAAPFVRPGWIEAWWQAFGRGELKLLTAHSGGELRGVLPIVERGRRLSSPVNAHTPLFGFVAADDTAAYELAHLLFSEGHTLSTIDPLDADDIGLWALREAAADNGYRLHVRTHRRSPYIEIEPPFDSFVMGLRRKFRSEIKRRKRRLEEVGVLQLVVHEGREDLETILTESLFVEASGKKGRQGTAIIQDATINRFYKDMSHWASAAGILRLATLMLDERIIAFDLALEDERSHYLVKTGYDQSFARFGPGMLLRYEMLARSFELGHSTYEFLGSDATWKREWTRTTRHHVEVRAFAPTLLGTTRWSAAHFGGPTIERLRGAARSALRH